MTELSGKVALITGASRGIGRGIALELASAGCDIMLTARDGKALEGVAEEIRALGRQAAIHAADLTADTEPRRAGRRADTAISAVSISWSTMPARQSAAAFLPKASRNGATRST